MSDPLLIQCCGCGRLADLNAKPTLDGPLCRFCQSERDGRCPDCGHPAGPWPFPTLPREPTRVACGKHGDTR